MACEYITIFLTVTNNFRIILKMNYAQAAKGKLSHDLVLREVDSQSEIELGRHLDPEEKLSLFRNFPPQLIFKRIQQVLFKTSTHYSI